MAKLTLADLKKLREDKKNELGRRDSEGKTVKVIIGMGTCGIAAGAKESFDAFLDEIDSRKLGNVAVTQTGCMGLCYAEPTVEVIAPDMPAVVYGNVKPDVARSIVEKHIVNKSLLSDHIFDKPAADIV
ncbi:Fe-only hydrogenase, subunit HydD [Chitinispirillum alkaliphilum]|nr:Fe-only hydrogenase, subunit HydD [Chitinispirillum alkaliphilum]